MVKTFPYLEITGTNYEVGAAIGEMFRGKIQETIARRKQYIRKYEEKCNQIGPYVLLTKKVFPHLISELQGMADGAEIPFQDLFFHNCPEIYDHTLEWDREQAQTEEHCTIAVSKTHDGYIIGHNEDWALESLDELYVLKATIGETTVLCLDYASFLMGSSASINNWGLAQCINELHQTCSIGIPKYFIARAVLDCKTINDAETLIRSLQRAAGYNHVLAQGTMLIDIEASNNTVDTEYITKPSYVHTNHSISHHVKQDEVSASPSSLARYERAHILAKANMTKKDMIALLSDTENTRYPICRKDITIGAVVIEVSKKRIHVCHGVPNRGVFVPYEL